MMKSRRIIDSARKAKRIRDMLPNLNALLAPCRLCGHECKANRIEGHAGFCRDRSTEYPHARVSSATLHFGEEPMLVGTGGSGAVFFTHCNLRCVFCQNYQISQLGLGQETSPTDLAATFLDLQRQGAENINLVTPTHYAYPILLALADAYHRGLAVPLVYNTNGYDSVELVRLLDGIVDVYLPDMKYMEGAVAEEYSNAENYPQVAERAIREMFRQVGEVEQVAGVARKGVIIRHLVLPGNLAGSYAFLLWLKDEGMMRVTLSLMSQYSPQHRAREFDQLNRPITPKEYRDVIDYALRLGFDHILGQDRGSHRVYLPDFRRDEPFERQ